MYRIVIRGEPREKPIDEEALAAFDRECRAAMGEAVEDLHRAVKVQLRKNKFPPSAREGSPPAFGGGFRPSGRRQPSLMASFRRLKIRKSRGRISGGIESRHPGAARLEYGAWDTSGTRTFAHPYLGPAQEEAEPGIENIFSRIVQI